MPRTRRELVFFVLGGFFLTNAILGELTGGKLIAMPAIDLAGLRLGSVVLSIGVIPWPVVFITTDLVNEYYGRQGVRKLTLLAVGMIIYAFGVLYFAIAVPAWERSPVTAEAFAAVFGQSQWIIVGSLAAFLTAQLIDVVIFAAVKNRTGPRLLWLRATGSTAFSQLVDTFMVGTIAFVLPGKLSMAEYLPLGVGSYLYKLAVAVLITPIIYLAHNVIDRYFEGDASGGGLTPRA